MLSGDKEFDLLYSNHSISDIAAQQYVLRIHYLLHVNSIM